MLFFMSFISACVLPVCVTDFYQVRFNMAAVESTDSEGSLVLGH